MPVPERPVLVAPDSFKGTFSAPQVAGAIGRGLERAGLMPPDLCPVADGGEGTLDALLPALGGEVVAADAHDPLGREVQGCFGLVEDGGTGVVEMAAASGWSCCATCAPRSRTPRESSGRRRARTRRWSGGSRSGSTTWRPAGRG